MDIPFTTRIKAGLKVFNPENRKLLMRPVLLAVVFAYLGGALMQLVHHQEGAHELIEINPVMHWLRDSSLALPLVFAAVWLGMRFTRWLVEKRSWKTKPWRTALVEMTTIAVLASSIMTAANPVHSWLFKATHAHEVSLSSHLLRDGLISLSMYLLFAGIFGLIWPAVPHPKVP